MSSAFVLGTSLTSSEVFFEALTSTVAISDAVFSLPMDSRLTFLIGESFIFRVSRLVAACKNVLVR